MDKKEAENAAAGHLSHLVLSDSLKQLPIKDTFPDEQLFGVSQRPWYADIVNYLAMGILPSYWNLQYSKKFLAEVKHFFWDDPRSNIAHTKFFGDVCLTVNNYLSSPFVTPMHVADTFLPRKLQSKFCNVVHIGHPFIKTIINFAKMWKISSTGYHFS